jgi:hypothetical protein
LVRVAQPVPMVEEEVVAFVQPMEVVVAAAARLT